MIRIFSITKYAVYSEVEALGDTSGMTLEVACTIMSNRPVKVTTWIDEETGNGFEQREYTLHDWEK